jgi:hypothetical protein
VARFILPAFRSTTAHFAICLLLQNCRIHLKRWFVFLESVRGVRPAAGGVESTFAGSKLVFPGRHGPPFSNKAIHRRIKLACQRNERRANLRDLEALLAIRISQGPYYTHIDSRRHSRGKIFGCTRRLFFCAISQVRPKGDKEIADKAVVQLLFSRLLRYREFVGCQL